MPIYVLARTKEKMPNRCADAVDGADGADFAEHWQARANKTVDPRRGFFFFHWDEKQTVLAQLRVRKGSFVQR